MSVFSKFKFIVLVLMLLTPTLSNAQYLPKVDLLQLDNVGFVTNYDTINKIPKWTYYKVEKSKSIYTSRGSFYIDVRTPHTQSPSNYKYTGYDKGHMYPLSLATSLEASKNCMLMTNMVPQLGYFNRGLWRNLEYFEYFNGNPFSYNVSGVIYSGIDLFINGIRVPKLFYKVIYHPTKGMIGFLVPWNGKGDIIRYIKTVDYLEKLTGIDFYYQLSDSKEYKLESVIDTLKWVW